MMQTNLMKFLVLGMLVLVARTNSWGQLEFPEEKVSWKFTVEQKGDEATIIGTITMVEHWHVYAVHLPEGSFTLPTTVELKKSPNFKTVGKVIEPKPIYERDEMADEDLYYHSHTIKLKQKIKVLSEKDFTVTGTFGFQTCDDTHCLPPYETEFTVKVKGAKAEEADSENIEDTFEEISGDEAKDKEGVSYVKVNEKWHMVPEGNSTAFYKKYLKLGGNFE